MYRRYYSMNDMPKIVPKCDDVPKKCDEEKCITKPCESKKLFGNFELDDIVLGIVILAILLDDGDDTLLLLALFAVFFAGFLT